MMILLIELRDVGNRNQQGISDHNMVRIGQKRSKNLKPKKTIQVQGAVFIDTGLKFDVHVQVN